MEDDSTQPINDGWVDEVRVSFSHEDTPSRWMGLTPPYMIGVGGSIWGNSFEAYVIGGGGLHRVEDGGDWGCGIGSPMLMTNEHNNCIAA